MRRPKPPGVTISVDDIALAHEAPGERTGLWFAARTLRMPESFKQLAALM